MRYKPAPTGVQGGGDKEGDGEHDDEEEQELWALPTAGNEEVLREVM